jgi:hypothetical protein
MMCEFVAEALKEEVDGLRNNPHQRILDTFPLSSITRLSFPNPTVLDGALNSYGNFVVDR